MNEQALDYKMQGFAMRLHLTAYRTNFGNTTTNIKTNRSMYLSSQGLWTVLELAFINRKHAGAYQGYQARLRDLENNIWQH